MTDNQKLIDDALTAFADREIPAPSRDDLRIALDAFEASLTLCGCEACTTARRERTGLTDHDRTSLARALHQIVYSPGANFDRAVPGIQEYMIACADKVAAALPWLVPQPTRPKAHTPTDDERDEATDENLWDFASDLLDAWNIEDTNAPSLSEDFRDRFVARFRRSEVPEPSAERIPEQCVSATCPVTTQHAFHERVFEIRPEPQGEPSDAQDDSERRAAYRREHRAELMRQERAALRAAGGERR